MSELLHITPETTVGELLSVYPNLESLLIAQAPPFRKLANPLLRRTVAKVATLSRVAEVGGLDVIELVNTLRAAAGQPLLENRPPTEVAPPGKTEGAPQMELPAWVASSEIASTVNADDFLARGEHPLAHVSAAVRELQPGQCLLLVSSFRPAPLIEKMQGQGYQVVSIQRGDDRHETYIGPSTA